MTLIAAGLADHMYEQAALWSMTPEVGQEPLVRLACEALVSGLDLPGLVQLAGQSVWGQDYEFAAAVAAALQDIGLTLPARGGEDAQIAAARAMSRLVLKGQLGPRELVRWTHTHIGHSGASDLQSLVELDDVYDTAQHVSGKAVDLDHLVLTAVRDLLDADRRLDAPWHPAPPAG